MNIRWRLRMAAAQREVWTGSQLRRLLAEKAGLEHVGGVGVGAVHQGAVPGEAVDARRAVHRPGLHSQRPVRRRHHPGRAARRSRRSPRRHRRRRRRPAAGPCRRSETAGMGKKQRDCAGCGAPVGIIGREHCCRCEREDPRGRSEGRVPGLREAAGPAGRDRPVHLVLPVLPRVRSPGPPARGHPVPGLPPQGPAGRGPAALPAMRPSRVSPRGHRLVRPVLPASPA